MFRVQVCYQYPKFKSFYGEPVKDLLDSHAVIAELIEQFFKHGHPHLDLCEIYVIGEDGCKYWWNEDHQLVMMN
jgi:hypothetical protein